VVGAGTASCPQCRAEHVLFLNAQPRKPNLICACIVIGALTQARICQRMSVKLISTPFEDRSYYTNIRKALVAGFFMQVSRQASSWPSG
jgi:hypothetical protein